jgi:hypothetical protein
MTDGGWALDILLLATFGFALLIVAAVSLALRLRDRRKETD